jgi:hypothetical protein
MFFKTLNRTPVIMNRTIYPIRFFMKSVGILLIITAVAKLISSAGNARILQIEDPIFYVPFRIMFQLIGSLELAVASICIFGRRVGMQAVLVAWLATSFAVYRLGLLWIGYHKPCSCLGNLTDTLHIAPQTADTAMKIILAYLLIGSYATLFWLWRQRKIAVSSIVGAASL